MAWCMLSSVCIPVMASASLNPVSVLLDPIETTPLWANTSTITFNIKYASGTATCTSVIIGKTGTKSIKGVYTLQKKTSTGYSNVTQWTVSTTGTVLTLSKTHAATIGNTYRLSLTATVVSSSNVSETITVASSDFKYV